MVKKTEGPIRSENINLTSKSQRLKVQFHIDNSLKSFYEKSYRSRHWRFAFFLLKRISNDQKGSKANGHTFWWIDDFDWLSNRQKIKDNFSHGKIQFFLCNKLDNFDKDVEGCISWHNGFWAFGKQLEKRCSIWNNKKSTNLVTLFIVSTRET